MSDVDQALDRLERAVEGFAAALAARAARAGREQGATEGRIGDEGAGAVPEVAGTVDLATERARLAEEAEALRATAARDAELRAEAADAVKAALADLRALVPEDAPANDPANDPGDTGNGEHRTHG